MTITNAEVTLTDQPGDPPIVSLVLNVPLLQQKGRLFLDGTYKKCKKMLRLQEDHATSSANVWKLSRTYLLNPWAVTSIKVSVAVKSSTLEIKAPALRLQNHNCGLNVLSVAVCYLPCTIVLSLYWFVLLRTTSSIGGRNCEMYHYYRNRIHLWCIHLDDVLREGYWNEEFMDSLCVLGDLGQSLAVEGYRHYNKNN